MKTRPIFKILLLSTLVVLVWQQVHAETINLNARDLIPKVELSFSPRTGSFTEGSTFDIPILINTKGNRINGVEIRISFDKDHLEIVKPSGGQSIVGVWLEAPSYDNARGLANYVGVIPSGITTSSGSIGSITFRAKKTGRGTISFKSTSRVLLNDGLGTEATLDLGHGEYTIIPKAPEGVIVASETHPRQDDWYNNNSPVFIWEKGPGVSGFSYVIDHNPNTIPENTIVSSETTKSFEGLEDGLWYFHIKANRNGAWGTTGHFLVRIDTAPPADFTPEADYLLSSVISSERALISFFTSDNLSGIDHYEIGVIDRDQPVTVSPVFVQGESSYQVPITSGRLSVIVRAIDRAGNVRDVSLAIGSPFLMSKFIEDHLTYIILAIILAFLIALTLYYLIRHHIIRYLRKAVELVKREEQQVSTPTPYTIPSHDEITNTHPESRQE
ncbi:cohesin domain-containing protein [Candidatus Parcubacteria bacterium]|nr:cohesin domain-containing protein [Candidatus Parcubacteria bacterium]